MIRELAVQDALRPIIIEVHVPTHREQERRTCQSCQDNDAEEKDSPKNVVTGAERVSEGRFQESHAAIQARCVRRCNRFAVKCISPQKREKALRLASTLL